MERNPFGTKSFYPFKGQDGRLVIRLYVGTVCVTEEYVSLAMLQVQCIYNLNRKTNLHLECVSFYNIHVHVPMVAETYMALFADSRYDTDHRQPTIECKACGLQLTNLHETSPLTFHQRCSPNCKHFQMKQLQGNRRCARPSVTEGQDRADNGNSQNETLPVLRREVEIGAAPNTEDIYTPKHPQYAQMDTRRRSYQNAGLPGDNELQSPEQLAAAGFFYTGDGDTVRCHYCGGGLRKWEPTDDPWVEHARWFPYCKFVLRIKGMHFIQASATGNAANELEVSVAPPVAPQVNERTAQRGKGDYTDQEQNVSNKMFLLSSYNIWPHRNIRTGPLVEAGFSCKDPNTATVECKLCGLTLDASTLNGTPPIQRHRQESPDCEFFNQNNSQGPDGQRHRALTVSSQNQAPSPMAAKRESAHSLVQQRPTETLKEDGNIQAGAQGGDCLNQIRNPRFTEQHERRQTYQYFPQAAADIDTLVDAGLFYTGDKDIVRCFYCDIGLAEWNHDDDPWVEHARHSPECPYLRNQKGQDYINNIQTQWAQIYTPKHPKYAQMDTRRRSYQNAGWPADNEQQTPEQLAAAGFFYTGDGDTVRCHYCDGGLREWEPADDPWREHARWFPFCRFLLMTKGKGFIQRCGGNNTASGLETLNNEDAGGIKEQSNPMLSAAAESLMEMGNSAERTRMAIEKFTEKTGRRHFNAIDLLEIILEMEEAGQLLTECIEGNIETGTSTTSTRDEIRKMAEYLVCRSCPENEISCVFLPGGHLVTDQEDEEDPEMIPRSEGAGTDANGTDQKGDD